MVASFEKHAPDMDFVLFCKGKWICFLERVVRQYRHEHERLSRRDPMHLSRESILKSAVNTVCAQIRPKRKKTSLPCEGDKAQIIKIVQPIVESTLKLAGPVHLNVGTKYVQTPPP